MLPGVSLQSLLVIGEAHNVLAQNSCLGLYIGVPAYPAPVPNGTDLPFSKLYTPVAWGFLLRRNSIFWRHGNSPRVKVDEEGETDMLGLIALVLIVLWLMGFFAFHVSAGLIHLLLVVGLILLVLHFVRGSTSTA
jgi:hypothetical protein